MLQEVEEFSSYSLEQMDSLLYTVPSLSCAQGRLLASCFDHLTYNLQLLRAPTSWGSCEQEGTQFMYGSKNNTSSKLQAQKYMQFLLLSEAFRLFQRHWLPSSFLPLLKVTEWAASW